MSEEIKNEEKTEDINENKDEQTQNEDLQELSELEKIQKELNEITDKFYRANADFENIKKRMEKEKSTALEYANEKFAKDILSVIDALEEACKIEVGENELAVKMQDGVRACIDIMVKTFEKYGIIEIKTDEGFNPEFHNAISMLEQDGKESGEIIQVYQKGYMYKDRVLRPSMVVVAK